MTPARRAGVFIRTGRGKFVAPGFNVHSKTAPSPPLTRRRRGGRAMALRAAWRIGACWRRQNFDSTPPQGAELAGLRPGLLRQVVPKRAVLDADSSPPVRHEGRFTDTPPGLAMELPRHASTTKAACWRQGAFLPSRWWLALPASGREPVKPSCGEAESAISPFGSGRPVRPWLVVNPGEGTAAPWASWPQPSSENNFPCAARIPRGTNSFRFQVLHVVATAARCDPPIPRRPVHNKDALARPCSTRKEKHHG